jgi:hypothetical protein
MLAIVFSLFSSIRHGFQTRAALQAEILALRHQLFVIQRSAHSRKLRLNRGDRFLWVWLSRLWSGWRSAYERSRTHLSLGKDAPVSRPIQSVEEGRIVAIPQVGGCIIATNALPPD